MVVDELRRMALFTSGVAELTRHQAEQIVKDFVKSGDVRRKQASSAAKELLERSKENRRELARFVRAEIQNQIEGLGLATKRDLERIERRVTRLEADRKGPKKKSTSRKTTAKKTTTKAPVPKRTGSKPASETSGPS